MKTLHSLWLLFILGYSSLFAQIITSEAEYEELIGQTAATVYGKQPNASEMLVALGSATPIGTNNFARYLLLKGSYFQLQQQFDSAKILLDSAYTIAMQDNPEGYTQKRIKYQLSTLQNDLGRPDLSIQIYSELVPVLENSIGNKKEYELLLFALDELSKCHYRTDNFEKSFEVSTRLMKHLEKDTLNKYNSIRLSNLINLCNYQNSQNHPSALDVCFESLKMAQLLNKEIDEAISLNNIGNYYLLQQNLDSAYQYLIKAMVLLEKYEYNYHLGPVYINIGYYHFKYNNYKLAIDFLERGKALTKKYKQHDYLTNAFKHLLNCHLRLGNFKEAEQNLLSYSEYSKLVYNENMVKELARLNTIYDLNLKDAENIRLAETNALNLEIIKLQGFKNKRLIIALIINLILFFITIFFFIRARTSTNRLKLANKELKELGKRKNQILSILSHDLRTPIIQMQQLRNEVNLQNLAPEERIFVESAINQNLANGLSMLENILTWAKGYINDNIIISEIHLNSILANVKNQISLQAEKKEIQLFFEQCNITVKGNIHLTEIIIRNLILNAIKFSNKGSFIWISCVQNQGKNCIVIKDQGSGMPNSLVTAINNDETIQPKTNIGTEGEPGSGLGLPLSIDFAKRMNARIKIIESSSAGTTICLVFDTIK